MRRISLLLLPALAATLVVATLHGRWAEAALATPGENEPTFTRVRMIAVHRKGFETIVVQPEFELPGAAAREVTINEDANEFSKTYGEPFRGGVGMCNARYGDKAGTVSVRRGKEETEPTVEGEGLTDHAISCVRNLFMLSAYEDVLRDPDDIEMTYAVAPDRAKRPPRLAWVIPVKGEPLHFGKAPTKIIDQVNDATEELIPPPPMGGDIVPGLPPATVKQVGTGSVDRVPGKGAKAVANLKRLLAEGQFGSIPDSDLGKYGGDWTFLLIRTGSPAPLSGRLEPVTVTFRAKKLVIPGRIYGSSGVRDFLVWVFSDRIIPPGALRSYGFRFTGRYTEEGREDGVDYQKKHVPASLRKILTGNAEVAPPLAPLAQVGAAYRFDGVPIAVQPNVWSSECELSFATFSSPRKMPDYVRPEEDALEVQREREGCGCAASGRQRGPGSAVVPFALAALVTTGGRRKRTGGTGTTRRPPGT